MSGKLGRVGSLNLKVPAQITLCIGICDHCIVRMVCFFKKNGLLETMVRIVWNYGCLFGLIAVARLCQEQPMQSCFLWDFHRF